MFGTRQVRPTQAGGFYMPQQSTTMPMAVGAQQLGGLDMTALMNLMITMMIIGMMMKMMTSAMAGVGSPKPIQA